MKCPKCPGMLREITIGDVKVDICWICEGIWFDKGELEKILKSDSSDFQLDNLGQAEMDGKEAAHLKKEINDKIGVCPRCEEKTKLQKEEYLPNKKLEIDICPKGHGIWLDGEEVQLLRNRTLVDIVKSWESFKTFLEHAFEHLGARMVYGPFYRS